MTSPLALPNDLLAEQLVVGSLLKDQNLMATLVEADLRPEHFWDRYTRAVYEAATALALQGLPPDYVTLSAKLIEQGVVTDREKAFDLLNAYEQDAGRNAIHYARLILDSAVKRETIVFAHQIQEQAMDSTGPELLAAMDQWLVLQQAQAAMADVENGPRPLAGFGPFEPQGWLLDQAIPYGYPTSWIAPAGSAKSFMSLSLALTVSMGVEEEWIGLPISDDARGRPSLYTDYELAARVSLPRAQRLANAVTGSPALPDNLHYLPAREHRIPLSTWAKRLPGWVKKHNYALVVLDSLSVAMDEDPSSPTAIIALLNRSVAFLSDLNCALLILDHPPKPSPGQKPDDGRGAYGTSAKKWLSRSIFMLSGSREYCARDEKRMTFRHTKSNFGSEMEPFGAMITWIDRPMDSVYPMVKVESCDPETDEDAEKSPDMSGTVMNYLLTLKGTTATNAEIAAETGLSRASMSTILGRLRDSGMVERPDRGQWRVTQKAMKLYIPEIPQQAAPMWDQEELPV